MDYKMQSILMRDKDNFESIYQWLYLGADIQNPSFAKIGITTGDLTSRSSSSGNPNYYIFCACKCRHDISESKLKSIEQKVLIKFDKLYPNKRLRHAESRRMSECFNEIDFFNFFLDLHYELFHNYRSDFLDCIVEDNDGYELGQRLVCEFNHIISKRYISECMECMLQ